MTNYCYPQYYLQYACLSFGINNGLRYLSLLGYDDGANRLKRPNNKMVELEKNAT